MGARGSVSPRRIPQIGRSSIIAGISSPLVVSAPGPAVRGIVILTRCADEALTATDRASVGPAASISRSTTTEARTGHAVAPDSP